MVGLLLCLAMACFGATGPAPADAAHMNPGTAHSMAPGFQFPFSMNFSQYAQYGQGDNSGVGFLAPAVPAQSGFANPTGFPVQPGLAVHPSVFTGASQDFMQPGVPGQTGFVGQPGHSGPPDFAGHALGHNNMCSHGRLAGSGHGQGDGVPSHAPSPAGPGNEMAEPTLARLVQQTGNKHRVSSGQQAHRRSTPNVPETFPVRVHTYGQLVDICPKEVLDVLFRSCPRMWNPLALKSKKQRDMKLALALGWKCFPDSRLQPEHKVRKEFFQHMAIRYHELGSALDNVTLDNLRLQGEAAIAAHDAEQQETKRRKAETAVAEQQQVQTELQQHLLAQGAWSDDIASPVLAHAHALAFGFSNYNHHPAVGHPGSAGIGWPWTAVTGTAPALVANIAPPSLAPAAGLLGQLNHGIGLDPGTGHGNVVTVQAGHTMLAQTGHAFAEQNSMGDLATAAGRGSSSGRGTGGGLAASILEDPTGRPFVQMLGGKSRYLSRRSSGGADDWALSPGSTRVLSRATGCSGHVLDVIMHNSSPAKSWPGNATGLLRANAGTGLLAAAASRPQQDQAHRQQQASLENMLMAIMPAGVGTEEKSEKGEMDEKVGEEAGQEGIQEVSVHKRRRTEYQ